MFNKCVYIVFRSVLNVIRQQQVSWRYKIVLLYMGVDILADKDLSNGLKYKEGEFFL